MKFIMLYKQKSLKTICKPVHHIVRNLYLMIPPPFRPGPFRQTSNLLKHSQGWDRKRHREYQVAQLRKLLHHSYNNVRYYRRVFDERSLKVEDFSQIEDLQRLPFLTKTQIIENSDDLISANFGHLRIRELNTGGSSGNPMSFFNQRGYSEGRELAFILRLWERCGYRRGEKRMVLRGPVVSTKSKFKYDHVTKELLCSSFHTDDEHLYSYYKELKKRDISYLHAHVSTAVLFAKFLSENGLKHKLKAVLAASEKVYPFQRKLLEETFETRVFSWYGQSEQVVLAGECEFSNSYHVFPEYGITELIDEHGNLITTPGKWGEIIGTGFNNYVMPFIRYRTGDIACYSGRPCSCGRQYPLFGNIEGRTYEYIYTEDGRLISLTSLIFGQHFEAFKRISRIQIFQEERGKIEIRIAKQPGYSQTDELEIMTAIKAAVGSRLELKFRYVTDIPLTSAGKHQFLIQKIPSAQFFSASSK